MTSKERLEVIKRSYEVLQGLVKRINEQVSDAKEGVDENKQDLIMGCLWGIDEAADRIRNVFAVMKYLHRDRG